MFLANHNVIECFYFSLIARPLYKLTSLGRAMSHFPISPRYSKMLAFAYKELFPYVIAIISGLTVQEIFLSDHVSDELADTKTEDALKLRRRKEQWHNLRRKWASNVSILVLLQSMCNQLI